MKTLSLPQTFALWLTVSWHILGLQTYAAHSHSHKHTHWLIPILHMPTVRSEAWSVSLSGFQLLSNISSPSHRPTVKESLHIDISWQSLNCINSGDRNYLQFHTQMPQNIQKVFLINCLLSLHLTIFTFYSMFCQIFMLDIYAEPCGPMWVMCDWGILSTVFWVRIFCRKPSVQLEAVGNVGSIQPAKVLR